MSAAMLYYLSMLLQDMEVAVGLNLFTSRMGESHLALAACLGSAAQALQAAALALDACCSLSAGVQGLVGVMQAAANQLVLLPVSLPGAVLGLCMMLAWLLETVSTALEFSEALSGYLQTPK